MGAITSNKHPMKTFKKVSMVSGSTLFAWLLAGVVAAQTTTTPVDTTGATPGVPNTGAGDITMNLVLLAISAVVVIVGGFYLARRGREV